MDEATAESAARQAIPALLGGLQANSEDPAGAASLAGALGDHSGDLLEGGVDLNQVDTGDGEKIVSNIFGPSSDQVAQTLGGALGGSQAGDQGDLMKRLLPILAPIVLAYLSKKIAGGKYGDLLGPLDRAARRRRRAGGQCADRHPRQDAGPRRRGAEPAGQRPRSGAGRRAGRGRARAVDP